MSKISGPARAQSRKAAKQARSAETMRVILAAAARILERQGHEGFTTNAVAEHAGVSIGSLYQYFPSKDALIGALIVQETSVLVAEAAAGCRQPTGRGAIQSFIAAAVAHQLRRPALARLLDFEEARLPLDPDTQRVAGELHSMLADALERPDLQPQPEPAVAAADVFAIVKGMVDAAGERGNQEAQALQERVTRAVFGYLDAGRPCADRLS